MHTMSGSTTAYRSFNDCYIKRCDGVDVRIRPVRADDRERFREGFERLSEESRYCRCFNYRKHLADSELDMLCNLSEVSQEALVALSLDEDGNEHDSIGGARYILNSANSDSAEMAFLVTDEWHRKQVGQWLLTNLVNHARSRGIMHLRCYLLPGNAKARSLLAKVAALTDSTMTVDEDGVLLELNS